MASGPEFLGQIDNKPLSDAAKLFWEWITSLEDGSEAVVGD